MSQLSATLLSKIKAINSKFPDAVVDLDKDRKDIEFLSSSGSLGLDEALGGGIVKGRIMEIYGPESCGKSTLCQTIAGEVQNKEGVVLYVDYEHAFHGPYAEVLGLDLSKLILVQPNNLEEGGQIMEDLLETGELSLIIIDSVSAMSPIAEVEAEVAGATVGLIARKMGVILRKITPLCAKKGTTAIFINQLRTNIGAMGWGDDTVTSGGNALKFFASVRIEMKKIGFESQTEGGIKKKTAQKVLCKVIKNKTFRPWEEASFMIEFGVGIVKESELVPLAIKFGLLKKCTKNKVAGIYLEYDTQLWDNNIPIEKNENDLMGVLREEEFVFIVKELNLRVKEKMGGMKMEEVMKEVEPLYFQFKEITENHAKLMEEAAKLTNSSKWDEAYPLVEEALSLKPWDKPTQQRFKVISEKAKRVEG